MKVRCGFVALILFALVPGSSSYHLIQHIAPDGRVLELAWGNQSFPVDYFLNSTRPLDFSLDAAEQALGQSFQIWQDVETADITFELAGRTSAEPFTFFDDQSTFGFTSDPDLASPGVLAATLQVINIFNAEIVEADVFFSNSFIWSVEPNGEAETFDFISVAAHEIGHFVGLDHSHVGFMESLGNGRRKLIDGAAIMFPFSFGPGRILGRTLASDDIAGISLLYPSQSFTQSTGSISGKIRKGVQGVAYAHVVSFNPFSGKTIGAFTDENGEYEIRGLESGPHTVRVNPIMDPASPPDFGFPEFLTDVDFRDALFSARPVHVTAPTAIRGIDIEVHP